MDTGQLVLPVGGNRTRRGRRFLCVLLAILMLGLALPAQAGLADLIDDLLNPVDLPIIDDVLDPVLEIGDPVVDVVAPVVDPLAGLIDPIVDGVVDPVLDQVVTPVVEEVVEPILEEVVPPLVGDLVPPPIEEILPPPIGDLPPIESAVDPGGSGVAGPAGPGNQPARISEPNSQFESGPDNVDAVSLRLAQSLQTRLALDGHVANGLGTGASLRVSEARVGATSIGWLDGLTEWLRSNADGLLGLLAFPVRLLEILIRALLTAGSGLVAPASLLLVFTAYAIRDRRSGRVQIIHSAA